MCGIIGIVSEQPFTSRDALHRLKKLEYRGYDSWGYWNGRRLTRRTGQIVVHDDREPVTLAIAHSRWATHGGVTEQNAHPHRVADVTVVHNGIIENWEALKEGLLEEDARFSSETDSEVIAHLVVQQRARGRSMEEALRHLCTVLKGTFAALFMVDGDPRLYAAKRDSPLALGICDGMMVLASDIAAFSDVTERAIFFENDEYAVIGPRSFSFFGAEGGAITKEPTRFSWTAYAESKQEYPHFMLKEIHEQPRAATRLLDGLATTERDRFLHLVGEMKRAEKVVFTAAGTAYHASLLGASFLHRCGIDARAIIASEFDSFITITPGTLVIAVSQSGETMDVVEALKYAKAMGARLGAIVNVPHSTIERMAGFAVNILAGQEVAVASTKAFTNQALLLLAVAEHFGFPEGSATLPGKIQTLLAQEQELRRFAHGIAPSRDLYLLGRRLGYPVAREIALKVKEVSYLHAEGMMGGELKHGTIALIEEGTPVIALVHDGDPKMRSSAQEVRARGARVIVLGTREGDDVLLPAENDAEFAILAAIAGQLLAYHIALARGCPIDKPRNLAKSVTVL